MKFFELIVGIVVVMVGLGSGAMTMFRDKLGGPGITEKKVTFALIIIIIIVITCLCVYYLWYVPSKEETKSSFLNQ